MNYSMLKEAIFLLKEMRFQQCNTGDCVTKCLDRSIRNLEALRGEKFSEPELVALILDELALLFSELPEFQEQLERMVGL